MGSVVLEEGDSQRTVTVRERPTPEPGPGEALVRVHHAGICGSDVGAYAGKSAYDFISLPRILGHEYAGVVDTVGDAVTQVAPGDRVVEVPLQACGTCPACRRGRPNVCENVHITGFHHDGGFAEYVTVPEPYLHPVPDGVELAQAALAEPLSVAGRAVFQRGEVAAGDDVLVLGPGPMGVFSALLCRAAGASVTVGGLPADESRLAALAAHDVETVDVTEVSVADRPGFEVAIDATGAAAAFTDCVEAIEPGGRAVALGIPSGELTIPATSFVRSEKAVLASYGATHEDFERTFDVLDARDLPLADFVTEYEPDDVTEAFEAFQAAAIVKPRLRFVNE